MGAFLSPLVATPFRKVGKGTALYVPLQSWACALTPVTTTDHKPTLDHYRVGQGGAALFPFVTGALASRYASPWAVQSLLIALMSVLVVLWSMILWFGRKKLERRMFPRRNKMPCRQSRRRVAKDGRKFEIDSEMRAGRGCGSRSEQDGRESSLIISTTVLCIGESYPQCFFPYVVISLALMPSVSRSLPRSSESQRFVHSQVPRPGHPSLSPCASSAVCEVTRSLGGVRPPDALGLFFAVTWHRFTRVFGTHHRGNCNCMRIKIPEIQSSLVFEVSLPPPPFHIPPHSLVSSRRKTDRIYTT